MSEETVSEEQQQPVSELETALQVAQDKMLRAHAELENYKKRKEQELDNFRKFAVEKYVLELLPVLDSFDRACEHDVPEGFLLIQKQFHSVLEKLGVKPIELELSKTAFDPHLHQAVLQEENNEVDAHTVLKEMQKGYMLHDRMLRPSMVVVSKKSEGEEKQNG